MREVIGSLADHALAETSRATFCVYLFRHCIAIMLINVNQLLRSIARCARHKIKAIRSDNLGRDTPVYCYSPVKERRTAGPPSIT